MPPLNDGQVNADKCWSLVPSGNTGESYENNGIRISTALTKKNNRGLSISKFEGNCMKYLMLRHT